MPGSGYLLFLRFEEGSPRLLKQTARAVVPLRPDLEGHVRSLLDPSRDRIEVLRDALESANPRIRTDAALQLSVSPGLEARRARIQTAVRAAIRRELVEDQPFDHAAQSRLRAMARTSQRIGDRVALDQIRAACESADRPRRAKALRSALQQLTNSAVRAATNGAPPRFRSIQPREAKS